MFLIGILLRGPKIVFQKLYKKTSINFIEYEETILVNSRINDLKLDTKLDISQEYITFIDSPLNHGDNVMVDGYIHENVHKIFMEIYLLF